ncbi:hypothetical protein Ahy_B02g059538 isoform A [Arachis hypogaea]|uniref:Mitochondrial inner membrane protease ATP23 n=1 Tax=Arachis hypogaea TaxID=3818 RepID=A0A445AGT3_ARAHY|nr:hypothetical protein Ahy_B02g059538 isoform A [Arachis hypogaea]
MKPMCSPSAFYLCSCRCSSLLSLPPICSSPSLPSLCLWLSLPRDLRHRLLCILCETEPMAQMPSSPHGLQGVKTVEEVQAMIQKSFRLPMVKFLRQRLAKAGCPVSDNFFKASECKGAHGTGGFVPGSGVLVCSNYMRIQDEVDQVVIHELINAFDDCRAIGVIVLSKLVVSIFEPILSLMGFYNLCHSCSVFLNNLIKQIRAGHLSGDCHFKRELLRGHMKLRGHEPECIKRRVLKSLSSNPNCAGSAAEDSMEAVWDICYNDTKPFDRAP